MPAHSLIPRLLHSSNPILTAVQLLEQPMSDPQSPLTNPIIGQEELAGEDCTHSSSMETGAEDVSPTSSSGVRGALERNTSSLLEAIEEEPAADKAAKEEADQPKVQSLLAHECTCPSEPHALTCLHPLPLAGLVVPLCGWFVGVFGGTRAEQTMTYSHSA